MSKNKDKKKTERNNIKAWAQYSGMAFQMMGIIFAGVFIGWQLDKWLKPEKPWFLFFFTIIFVILSVYYMIKDLIRMK
jgi:F0F1-type ATP synthase assembly protein I